MRLVIQRAYSAAVSVKNEIIGSIGQGLVVFVGVGRNDSEAQAEWLAKKVAKMRVFDDTDGKLNLSLKDIAGETLIISQFTLYADAQKGHRPTLYRAASPNVAEPLVRYFANCIHNEDIPVAMGAFGEHMDILVNNDGPVTIVLER